jgi:hypothetical protein
MKTITFILLCITLTTTAAWANDYHLVATQLRGAPASDKPAKFQVVYVLLNSMPNAVGYPAPLVYAKFDSEDIRSDIRSIPAGSVLHFDPSPLLPSPPDAEMQSLKAYCKKLGISLVVSYETQ